ncbi:MAG TPA: cytochrome c [Novosphingobium sp.]
MGSKHFRRAATLAFLVLATPLLAAPADTIRTRVAGLRELGAAFKAVNDGLRSNEPQTILLQQSARQIRNAANAMSGWFPRGSGPETRLKTAAKPEIWTQAPRFQAAQNAFIAKSGEFQAAVGSGNVATMRAKARELGATCKACHDSFRVPST